MYAKHKKLVHHFKAFQYHVYLPTCFQGVNTVALQVWVCSDFRRWTADLVAEQPRFRGCLLSFVIHITDSPLLHSLEPSGGPTLRLGCSSAIFLLFFSGCYNPMQFFSQKDTPLKPLKARNLFDAMGRLSTHHFQRCFIGQKWFWKLFAWQVG